MVPGLRVQRTKIPTTLPRKAVEDVLFCNKAEVMNEVNFNKCLLGNQIADNCNPEYYIETTIFILLLGKDATNAW